MLVTSPSLLDCYDQPSPLLTYPTGKFLLLLQEKQPSRTSTTRPKVGEIRYENRVRHSSWLRTKGIVNTTPPAVVRIYLSGVMQITVIIPSVTGILQDSPGTFHIVCRPFQIVVEPEIQDL